MYLKKYTFFNAKLLEKFPNERSFKTIEVMFKITELIYIQKCLNYI